jgi:Ca-activated chloride channel homolog
MTWYQSFTFLELFFCGLFLLLYGLYILRIKRLAAQFGQKAHLLWLKFAVRSAYFGLLILAILGPSFGAMKAEIRTIGKDIFVLVDVSKSMDAPDVPPSRMSRIKYSLAELIQRFNADRIGLIIFSSEAYLHCPLTFDQNALLLYTQALHTDLIPRSGTEFKPALDLALEKITASQPKDEARAKIILLISDGENFGEDLEPYLRRLRQETIRFFVLGVGTVSGERIPVHGGFQKDAQGQEVTTRLARESLQDMIRESQGQYFEITEQGNDTEKLLAAINSIEGEVRESRLMDITANKYFYPLLLALLLITFDVLLTIQVIRI